MLSTMYAMSQCQPNHDDENQYAEITPLVISRGAYCTPQYCFLLLTHSHSHNPYELQSTTSKMTIKYLRKYAPTPPSQLPCIKT